MENGLNLKSDTVFSERLRMKIKYFILLLVFAVNLNGQTTDAQEVRDRLQKLALKITTIRSQAIRYNNQAAIEKIENAQQEYVLAFDFLRQDPPDLLKAKFHFLNADRLANQAAKLVLYEPLSRLKKELDQMMHRAELAVHRSGSDEARYFLTKAGAFRNKAEEEFRNGRPIRSQELARISYYFAQKTIDIAEGNLNTGITDNDYEDKLINIENLYSEVAGSMEKNTDLDDLLKKSRLFIDKSSKLYEQGSVRQALVQLQISERLLYRALDISQSKGTNRENEYKINLYSLRRYIEAVESGFSENTPARAGEFLRKAKQFYLGAEKALDSKKYKEFESNVALSNRFAGKALQLSTAETDDDFENIPDRLNEIGQIFRLQNAKAVNSGNTIVIFFNEEAGRNLNMARRAYANGNSVKALVRLQIALRFINRAEYMLGRQEDSELSDMDFEGFINRYNDILDRLKQNREIDSRMVSMIEAIEDMLDILVMNYRKGDIGTASELANIIQSQVNELLKKSR